MSMRAFVLGVAIVLGLGGTAQATTGHGWWNFGHHSNHYSKKHHGSWGGHSVSYGWKHTSHKPWSQVSFSKPQQPKRKHFGATFGLFDLKSHFVGKYCPPEEKTPGPTPPSVATAAVPVPMSAALIVPAFALLAASGRRRKKDS